MFLSEIIPESEIWLGIVSSEIEQNFVTAINGSTLSYNKWLSGSPNMPILNEQAVSLNKHDHRWSEDKTNELKSVICAVKSMLFSEISAFIFSEYCIRMKSDANLCQSLSSPTDEIAIYQNDTIKSIIPYNFKDFEYCISFDEASIDNDRFKIQATNQGVSSI